MQEPLGVPAQIRPGHNVGKELRRVATRRVRDALDALSHEPARDEDIHEARKSLKKSRAVLRLMRGAVGSKAYRHENIALRDIARPLSVARDSSALLEALDSIVPSAPGRTALSTRDLRSALLLKRQDARRVVSPEKQTQVCRALRASIHRLSRLRHVGNEWKAVERDLRRTYSDARDALEASQTRPDELHEWRKQTKYVRYQLHVLRPAWPSGERRLDKDLSDIAQLLGDDHDLAVLRGEVLQHQSSVGGTGASDALLKKLDRRRASLQQKAWALGRRVFAATPRQFTRRLEAGWDVASR